MNGETNDDDTAADLADHIQQARPRDAERLFLIAADLHRSEGTQATGSGEGLMAQDNLRRVEEKRRRVSAALEP